MRATAKLTTSLSERYGNDPERSWYLVSNARSGLELVLKSLDTAPGSEVIVQSFTCVTAVNPVLWAGLKPVYVDIDPSTLSLSLDHLNKLITPRTKAIIVQHTFGLAGPIEAVVRLAKEHGLVVIEDCAHALGINHAGRPLGTFGDAAIISFGVDKMLPTVFGGALTIRNRDLNTRVAERYAVLPELSYLENERWLAYPKLRRSINRLPQTIGSRLRGLLVRLTIQRIAISPAEYRGGRSDTPTAKLNDQHAARITARLGQLDANLFERESIANTYARLLAGSSQLTLLFSPGALIRYPILCATAELRDDIEQRLSARGAAIITWYNPALFPAGTDNTVLHYDPATCPVAEDIARRIITLPTGPDLRPDYATMIANELIAATTHFQG